MSKIVKKGCYCMECKFSHRTFHVPSAAVTTGLFRLNTVSRSMCVGAGIHPSHVSVGSRMYVAMRIVFIDVSIFYGDDYAAQLPWGETKHGRLV